MLLIALPPIVIGMLVAMPVTVCLHALVLVATKLGGAKFGTFIWCLLSALLVLLPILCWNYLTDDKLNGSERGALVFLKLSGLMPFIAVGTCGFSFIFLLFARFESKRYNKKSSQFQKERIV